MGKTFNEFNDLHDNFNQTKNIKDEIEKKKKPRNRGSN